MFLCFVQELTGKLPKEYPLDPGEEPPTVRRKIGTAFKLDEQKILPKGEVSLRFLHSTLCVESRRSNADSSRTRRHYVSVFAAVDLFIDSARQLRSKTNVW